MALEDILREKETYLKFCDSSYIFPMWSCKIFQH